MKKYYVAVVLVAVATLNAQAARWARRSWRRASRQCADAHQSCHRERVSLERRCIPPTAATPATVFNGETGARAFVGR